VLIKVRILESFVCFAWLISLLVRVLVLIKHTGSLHTIKINCEFISSESDNISKSVIAQVYNTWLLERQYDISIMVYKVTWAR